MVGIRKLAHELQLSIGTVSRALNDRPDVNPETRARVKAAAARVGYVPNQSGRSLRSGRTGIVAVVIPSHAAGVTADSGLFIVLEGARRTLRRHGLDLMVLFRGPDEDMLGNLQRFVERRIADAVILTQTLPHDPRLAYLRNAGLEHVCFGRSLGFADAPAVDFDIETMAAEATRIFVADGHRRIALATGRTVMNYEHVALEAMAAEARRLGLRSGAVGRIAIEGGRLEEADRRRFAHGSGPTAILASHEHRCAALYARFAELGLTIGRDVSIVCTFPVLDAQALSPSLSHFDADLEAVGVALAERLLPALTGGRAEPVPLPTLVPLRFVPLASHGRAAALAQREIQAPFRAEERTQASTKATPATPSSIVG
jgi:DNA-binding LacI/PurR family transcriptional regulator